MPFRGENVQPANFDYFGVLGVSLRFVAREYFIPLTFRTLVFGAVVVEDNHFLAVLLENNLASNSAQRLGNAFLYGLLTAHELRVSAEQNVRAAAGHVGSDGHGADPPRLGHKFPFR